MCAKSINFTFDDDFHHRENLLFKQNKKKINFDSLLRFFIKWWSFWTIVYSVCVIVDCSNNIDTLLLFQKIFSTNTQNNKNPENKFFQPSNPLLNNNDNNNFLTIWPSKDFLLISKWKNCSIFAWFDHIQTHTHLNASIAVHSELNHHYSPLS